MVERYKKRSEELDPEIKKRNRELDRKKTNRSLPPKMVKDYSDEFKKLTGYEFSITAARAMMLGVSLLAENETQQGFDQDFSINGAEAEVLEAIITIIEDNRRGLILPEIRATIIGGMEENLKKLEVEQRVDVKTYRLEYYTKDRFIEQAGEDIEYSPENVKSFIKTRFELDTGIPGTKANIQRYITDNSSKKERAR